METPQRELAGKVMLHMKTTGAAMTSVISDHIGVYLGVMKGWGRFVKVSEKSSVKAIEAASSEKVRMQNGIF